MEVSSFKKTVRLLALSSLLTPLVLLTGCSEFTPLPDEERYQYINQALDDLEYENTGTVVKEGYDKNDGVFSPSYHYATIEGSDTYDLLSQRMQDLQNAKCYATSPTQTRCAVGEAEISLYRENETDTTVILKVLDSSSGRGPAANND